MHTPSSSLLLPSISESHSYSTRADSSVSFSSGSDSDGEGGGGEGSGSEGSGSGEQQRISEVLRCCVQLGEAARHRCVHAECERCRLAVQVVNALSKQNLMSSIHDSAPDASKLDGNDEAISRGLEQLKKVQKLQQGVRLQKAPSGLSPTKLPSHKSALLSLKKKVSKKKRRFESSDGVSLDLTYITDHIIAMGFPSQGVEAIYRNDMKDVRWFLDSRHKDHYKVYNLCSERQYDASNFHGRVMRFPFDDHNCPAFDRMDEFLEDVHGWLNQHPENVVVIHCKAGKGRTGVTIATYMLYCGMWETAAQALSYYGFVRTQNSKGVTIPSQRRWVYYYETFMALKKQGLSLPAPEPRKITKIYISEAAPQFTNVVLKCEAMHATYDTTSWKYKWRAASGGGGEFLSLSPANVVLAKDVFVSFRTKKMLSKKSVFQFWFNTQFVKHGYLRLRKDELDKANKKKKLDDFYIEVFFDTYDATKVAIDLKIKEDEEQKRNSIVENMKLQFGFEGSVSSDSDDDTQPNAMSIAARSCDAFPDLDDAKNSESSVSRSFG